MDEPVELKRYNVGGLDVLGNGRPAPADTILKLSRRDAARLGLARAVDEPAEEPKAKPRRARTGKRPAPEPAKKAVPAKKAAARRPAAAKRDG